MSYDSFFIQHFVNVERCSKLQGCEDRTVARLCIEHLRAMGKQVLLCLLFLFICYPMIMVKARPFGFK